MNKVSIIICVAQKLESWCNGIGGLLSSNLQVEAQYNSRCGSISLDEVKELLASNDADEPEGSLDDAQQYVMRSWLASSAGNLDLSPHG